MTTNIDCLLVAYSGLDKKSKEFQNLIKKNPYINNIPTSLNSAITYLATSLENQGLTFDFINSIEDDIDILIEMLKTKKIKCVGVSTTICDNIDQLIKLINLIKGIDSTISIILGGALIVNYVRTLWEKGEAVFNFSLRAIKADFIIDSIYGEDKLASIVYKLKNNVPVDDIPNIFQKVNGKFIRTDCVEEEYILEEKKINWQLFKGRTGNTVSIRTSISCYFKCMFCSFPIRAGKYKSLNVEHIERDLNEIEKLGEVKLVQFVDDTFNVPLNRFKDILRMMIKNKYSFKWHSFIRCQSLDEEAVQLMKQSGCIGAFLGLESGSNIVLKVMNKATNVEQYRRGIELLIKYEIAIVASFFAGFPGETVETLDETLKFIEETKPTFYYLGPWIYDHRTPIHKRKEEYKLTGTLNNWSHKSMNSETANKLVLKMKSLIHNSTLIEKIHYPFLFQIINSDIELETIRGYFKCELKEDKIS